jgi:hypothetical protein
MAATLARFTRAELALSDARSTRAELELSDARGSTGPMRARRQWRRAAISAAATPERRRAGLLEGRRAAFSERHRAPFSRGSTVAELGAKMAAPWRATGPSLAPRRLAPRCH